jgi:sporulation protein YlmC with PRC-barrel domain
MRSYHVATAALLTAVLSGPALAQTANDGQTADNPFIAEQQPGQVLGSNLLETVVIDTEGSELGMVEDIIVDQEGRLVAVLVGIGGFLGIGEKVVAIDTAAVRVDTMDDPEVVGEPTGATEPHETPSRAEWVWWSTGDVRRIIVDATREELTDAPAFTSDEAS